MGSFQVRMFEKKKELQVRQLFYRSNYSMMTLMLNNYFLSLNYVSGLDFAQVNA